MHGVNIIAGKGKLVDLMHGELLTGITGLGEEWRIPIYRWSERLLEQTEEK
jgi:hypothetical protein